MHNNQHKIVVRYILIIKMNFIFEGETKMKTELKVKSTNKNVLKQTVAVIMVIVSIISMSLIPITNRLLVSADTVNLPSGLIGHWQFDTVDATPTSRYIANKVIGKPNAIIYTNNGSTALPPDSNYDMNPTFAALEDSLNIPKNLGQSLRFSGSDATISRYGMVRVDNSDATYTVGTGSFSISLWYKPTNSLSPSVLASASVPGGGFSWKISTSGSTNKGLIATLNKDSSNKATIEARNLFTTADDNTWIHVILVVNRNRGTGIADYMQLTVNGNPAFFANAGATQYKLAGTASTASAFLDLDANTVSDALDITALRGMDFVTSTNTGNKMSLNGVVSSEIKVVASTSANAVFDEVRVYNRGLNSTEVTKLFTDGSVIEEANPFVFASNTPSTKTYGDAPFTVTTTGGDEGIATAFSISQGGTVASIDSVSGLVTINNAGSFTITATKGTDTITQDIVVIAKALKLYVDPQMRRIGDTTPISYTYKAESNWPEGVTLTGSLSCAIGSTQGKYPISQGTLATSDSNYIIDLIFSYVTLYALPGDANLDGMITNTDLTALQNHLNSTSILTGDAFKAADIKKNSILDSDDLTAMTNLMNDTRQNTAIIDVTGKKGNAEGKTNADYPSYNRTNSIPGNGRITLSEPRAIIDTVSGANGYFARLYGDEGTPLMLIHGNKGSGYAFADIIPELATRYQLIVVDLPGDGYGPARGASETDKVDTANYCVNLATYLGIDKFAVLGHSVGGMVALEMYNTAPSMISEIILLESFVSHPDGTRYAIAGNLFNGNSASGVMTTQRILDISNGTDHSWWSTFDATGYFKNITVPVLEIQAESGASVSLFNTWLATSRSVDKVPANWTFQRIMSANHFVMFDQPGETVKAVDNFFKNNTFTASISFSGGIISTNNICTGLTLNSTVLSLKAKITPTAIATYKITDKNSVESLDTALITTGSKIIVYYNGNPVTTYTIIIYGDVDEDGDIKIADLASIKHNILQINTYDADQQLAGDINKNSSITISDLIAVKKHLLNITLIAQ